MTLEELNLFNQNVRAAAKIHYLFQPISGTDDDSGFGDIKRISVEGDTLHITYFSYVYSLHEDRQVEHTFIVDRKHTKIFEKKEIDRFDIDRYFLKLYSSLEENRDYRILIDKISNMKNSIKYYENDLTSCRNKLAKLEKDLEELKREHSARGNTSACQADITGSIPVVRSNTSPYNLEALLDRMPCSDD